MPPTSTPHPIVLTRLDIGQVGDPPLTVCIVADAATLDTWKARAAEEGEALLTQLRRTVVIQLLEGFWK